MNHRESPDDVLSLRRALLDSARLDVRPVPASVRRQLLMAATVAGVTSASAGAGAASGALSSSLTMVVAKWLGIGSLLVAAGAASYHATGKVRHPHAVSATVAERPKLAKGASSRSQVSECTSSSPFTLLSGERAITASSGEPISRAEFAGRSSPQPNRVTSTPSTTEPLALERASVERNVVVAPSVPPVVVSEPTNAEMPSSLTVELGMLDRARSRLTAGDPNGTLASLDAYARAFPNGGLQPEAMLLRIQALLQSGQSARAREFGALFLRQYPSSPHAMRVRSLLQSSGAEDIP